MLRPPFHQSVHNLQTINHRRGFLSGLLPVSKLCDCDPTFGSSKCVYYGLTTVPPLAMTRVLCPCGARRTEPWVAWSGVEGRGGEEGGRLTLHQEWGGRSLLGSLDGFSLAMRPPTPHQCWLQETTAPLNDPWALSQWTHGHHEWPIF